MGIEDDNKGLYIGMEHNAPLKLMKYQGNCQKNLVVSGMPGVGKQFRYKGELVISREIGLDTNISLRAKGLYYFIKSYSFLNGFKVTKEFLKSKSIEGDRAFDRAWKELKDSGYLKVNRNSGKGGIKWNIELL